MSRGSPESPEALADMEEGRLGSHSRAQPSGRTQSSIKLALSRALASWPLVHLLPQSLVGSAADRAGTEACALGDPDMELGNPPEIPSVSQEGEVSQDGSRAARREARHARRDKRIAEAAGAISRPDFDLDSAMAMYNLQHVEVRAWVWDIAMSVASSLKQGPERRLVS